MNNYDDIFNSAPAAGKDPEFSKEEFAARKKAEREDLYLLSDSTALEVAGDSGRFRQYLDVHSRFDRYSAVNSLLILAQKPEAVRLGSFDHWKEKGGSIKTGQTGFSILEPQEYTKDDGSLGVGFNTKRVFDISQIDAKKIKAEPVPPTYSDRQLLTALVAKAPVKISSVDDLPANIAAITSPETGEITVRRGMAFTDTFRSVAQELASAQMNSGPESRIDSGFSAYCASYILCKKYGVDTQDFDFSGAPEVMDGMDAQEVKAELSKIHNAISEITGRITRNLDSMQKAARDQEAR